MALNLQEVLDSLGNKTDAADHLFAKLAENNTETPETPEVPEVIPDEQVKIAEVEELGRTLGRAFTDSLEKTAVGKVGMTPETGGPMNPGIAMPANNADINPQVLAQAMALINQALSGVGQTGSLAAGSIGGEGQAALQVPAPPDHHPIVTDTIPTPGRVKTAGDRVIEEIWGHYFGGEE